jgi:hypothetical protein
LGLRKLHSNKRCCAVKLLSKVTFTEYVGRRKKTTRVEVKQSELDQMIKDTDNPVSVQLRFTLMI